MLSHDTWKNMKRIGIKGSHLVFFFNFGGRDSLKMIYKANYFIFPFNMIMGGWRKEFSFCFKIQNTNWISKGSEGSLSPSQSACLPSMPPRKPGPHRTTKSTLELFWGCWVAQSCPTVSDPPDCSPPASSVYGTLRQEHWSGLLCPPPWGLPDPGIKPTSLTSPSLVGGGGRGVSLPLVPPGSCP